MSEHTQLQPAATTTPVASLILHLPSLKGADIANGEMKLQRVTAN